MFKKIREWFARPDGAQLESIKRDYLERGYKRGQSAMRHGSIFDLYLMRSDMETAAEAGMSLGAVVPRAGEGPQYRWWAVTGENGREVCLGPLDQIEPGKALRLYLELLEDEQLEKLRGSEPTATYASLPASILYERAYARERAKLADATGKCNRPIRPSEPWLCSLPKGHRGGDAACVSENGYTGSGMDAAAILAAATRPLTQAEYDRTGDV